MKTLRLVFVFCAGFFASAHAMAQSEIMTDEHGVAANGFDVVAYFDNEAVRGLPGIEIEYAGATWYFETQANADKFQRDPAKYAPQFGGYCAYGVSQGYLVGTDPYAWSVVGGKLFLNYNSTIRNKWLTDVNRYVSIAENHWPRLTR